MAAIDIVGNTVIVTAAGTMNATYSDIKVGNASVWWVNTTGNLVIEDIGTGSISVRRFSPDRSGIAPWSEWVPFDGIFGRLSFTTVTACSLTFQLE